MKNSNLVTAYLIVGLLLLALTMSSCKSSKKYFACDAYKTQYKPIKAEKHKHHGLCDADN
jgi:hypothetical protein